MARAIAVDFGAGSGRIALGEMVEGKIRMNLLSQVFHEPRQSDGHLRWRLQTLVDFCRSAVELAEMEGASSVAIDSWGVDFGMLDRDGDLLADPICYRDRSHVTAFESLEPYRERLYRLTGTQHQPFNTICQLLARRLEQPAIVREVADWMILPDLIGYLLTRTRHSEMTQASTTQLLGLDGTWSKEAFEIAGWPVPDREPAWPGTRIGALGPGIDLLSVGSHDTASAVAGFGRLGAGELFLNIGTWSLCGLVLDEAVTTEQAEHLGFTNERTVDGKVRFLKNIPGFFFINRLHSELGLTQTVPEWLSSAAPAGETVDLFRPEFFNPDSMVDTCALQLAKAPDSSAAWASLALDSLVSAVRKTVADIKLLTGRRCDSIRVGGGGSQSEALCRRLSVALGVRVMAGPAEATLVGNLAAQFLAQGQFSSWAECLETVERSLDRVIYGPS